MTQASLLAALGLALIHVFARYLSFLRSVPRSRWLSMAGGVAVAFVILQILPALARDQQVIAETVGGVFGFLDRHIYIMVLLGLATYYGVHQAVKSSDKAASSKSSTVFWLSMSTFSLMNVIIGYLLVKEDRGPLGLLLFFVAMALKFMVNDRNLHDAHEAAYDRLGRWVVAAAVLLGWGAGYALDVPRAGLGMLRAFLVGGVLLNVLRQELPGEGQSSYRAFVLRAGVYGALLLVL